MTKQAWIKHIEEETGETFTKEKGIDHVIDKPDCSICKARRKTIKANRARQARDEAMRSIGLVKCKVNGRTYWE